MRPPRREKKPFVAPVPVPPRVRRTVPATAVPVLRGVVADGSNLIATAAAQAATRLGAVVAWARTRWPSLPVQVWLDATTAARLGEARLAATTRAIAAAGGVLAVAPPGVVADSPLLAAAQAQGALVLGNDRYADHAPARAGLVLLGGACRRGAFVPDAEATWFRTPGPAVRVALAELRTG